MTTDPDTVVTEFCALWANPDPEQILSYFTEDAVYQNIPMPPAEGRAAIKDFLAVMLDGFEGIDFTVHRQIVRGELVMNERTVTPSRTGGRRRRAWTDRSRPSSRTATNDHLAALTEDVDVSRATSPNAGVPIRVMAHIVESPPSPIRRSATARVCMVRASVSRFSRVEMHITEPRVNGRGLDLSQRARVTWRRTRGRFNVMRLKNRREVASPVMGTGTPPSVPNLGDEEQRSTVFTYQSV